MELSQVPASQCMELVAKINCHMHERLPGRVGLLFDCSLAYNQTETQQSPYGVSWCSPRTTVSGNRAFWHWGQALYVCSSSTQRPVGGRAADVDAACSRCLVDSSAVATSGSELSTQHKTNSPVTNFIRCRRQKLNSIT